MKYAQIRDSIKTGDVLACQGTEIFSHIIRWWCESEYSHVGLVAWMRFGFESRDRLCVFQADGPTGVELIPLTMVAGSYGKEGGRMWWCPITDSSIKGEEVLGHALDIWGQPFIKTWEWFWVISKTVQRIRRWRHGGRSADPRPTSWHCAKVVATAFQRAGLTLEKEPFLTVPADVARFRCLGAPVLLEF